MLKLLGKTAQTQIVLSKEMLWTLYNFIYLEDNTAYGMAQWGTQLKPENIQDMEHSALFSIKQTETHHNPF